METYSKPSLTVTQQVKLLESRGLVVTDKKRVIRHLSNISYYRLSAYMLPYKKKIDGKIIDEYKQGTTWEMVYNLYVFDRKLRLLIFDAVERIEIAIRAQIIQQLSQKYGSHWQDNKSIFKQPSESHSHIGDSVAYNVYKEIQKHIKEQLSSPKEVFIKHYKNKYSPPVNPPSWMCVEVMYFSHLSRICSGLKNRSDINGISTYFGLPPQTFCSWLHCINYVRNICAHHARLWNRDFSIVPEKLRFTKRLVWISNPDSVQRSKLYYFICMLNYMLQVSNPTSTFKHRIRNLIEEYHDIVKTSAMGFPEYWAEEQMWK